MNDDKNSIAIFWHIDDIKEVDASLTDAQARQVLQRLKSGHDASIGVTWEVIACVIDAMKQAGQL